MGADLTWQQRQCKALGLPFDGAQPPALLIALHDAGNPDLGLEQHALYAALPHGTTHASDDVVDDYLKRIAAIIRRSNMFDELAQPVLKITCVPGLNASGNFAVDEKIMAREVDWHEYNRVHAAELNTGPRFMARITLPANE